eukprot:6446827-Amphidinium_carterae.1
MMMMMMMMMLMMAIKELHGGAKVVLIVPQYVMLAHSLLEALLRDACADLDTVVRGRREKLGKEHKDMRSIDADSPAKIITL